MGLDIEQEVPFKMPSPETGIFAGIESAGGGALNFFSDMINRQYNKRMQKEVWNREDSAVQRRAKDLELAGINPVMAAGSAASSSSPIQVGAPKWSSRGVLDSAEKKRINMQEALLKAEDNNKRWSTHKIQKEAELISSQLEEFNRNKAIAKANGMRSDLKDPVSAQIQNLGALLGAGGNIIDAPLVKILSKLLKF